MTKKLKDVVPETKIFENETKTQMKKEDLLGATFSVIAHSNKIPSQDGEFMIILCEDNNKQRFTTTTAKILFSRLTAYGRVVGYQEGVRGIEEQYFKDPCEVTLGQRTSNNNQKQYFVFD